MLIEPNLHEKSCQKRQRTSTERSGKQRHLAPSRESAEAHASMAAPEKLLAAAPTLCESSDLHEKTAGSSTLTDLWAAQLEKSTRYKTPANGPVKAHISGALSTPGEPGETH